MPIAVCSVSRACFDRRARHHDPVQLWSQLSGQSANQMTINVACTEECYGRSYDVLSRLLLPDVWSAEDVATLQVSLATALATYFQVPIDGVVVVTSLVRTGHVVENGELQRW
ncbi:hypothetical protein [Marinobacter sp. X15-166B]|uniref:hypothetical protein n=1 Tax=Marinobacter sp. X15-166B TaxID=1897620 RepID=UPI00085C1636|nr:hypothetical protein [Marinobacter sp. X15-166B]OEY65927.1 hypothetical protein BG841_05295 [Marinobacter sp. X15-166B]